MVNTEKKSTTALSTEGPSLDKANPIEPGSLSISLRLRDALSSSLRKCKLSRYQVAARMSEFTGADISKTMLDAYTAESKEYHRFPAEWIPSFVAATGEDLVLRVLAETSGCKVLSGQEALYAEIARLDRQEEEIRKKKEFLRRNIR